MNSRDVNVQMYTQIAIDTPLRKMFTYRVPEALQQSIKRGCRVLVSFSRRKAVGFCVRVDKTYDETRAGYPEKDLKDVEGVNAEFLFEETFLKWLEFASEYYLTSLGHALSQVMPGDFVDPKQFQILKKRRGKPFVLPKFSEKKILILTEEQNEIVKKVLHHEGEFFPALLQGVTGSGKTEVYIEIIKTILQSGRSALYLVPEIGLTPQTLSRLGAHFHDKLLVFHSGLTANQRRLAWEACLQDEPKVMVGTRSALFSPLKNLGVIVIDEEHDGSYKQEDRFRYHARDLALVRAKMMSVPILLGTATPSLETYYLASQGKIHHFHLASRVGGSLLPKIKIIDFGKEKQQFKTPWLLSEQMTRAIHAHTENKKQVIVFVGHRGHAQNAYCESCRKIQVCANCDVGLKFHAYQNVLKCHYCEFSRHFDGICEFCSQKTLIPLGLGTQSVEEELKQKFPKLKIVRVDSDAFSSIKKLQTVFEDFAKGKIDLILGTQMLTKGHDFSKVGLVGIVGIESHLGLPDFRSSEKAFQTLVQVAGRAGREKQRGEVFVQSLFPEHESLKLAVKQDYDDFAESELKHRKTLCYPPYYRVAQLRFLSHRNQILKDFFSRWQIFLEKTREDFLKKKILLMGPTEMAIYKLRGRYRYHILLKIPREFKSAEVARYLVEHFEKQKPKGIECLVDIDPIHLV